MPIRDSFTVVFRSEGAQKLRSMTASIGESMNRLGQIMTRVTRIMAGAAVGAVTAFGVALERSTRRIDKLTKEARKVGVAVNEFQALADAAEQAGVKQEVFSRGLTNLQRNLKAALDGNKAQVEAFKELGLIPERLGKLGTQDVFELVAKRLGKFQDPVERARSLQGRPDTVMAMSKVEFAREMRAIASMTGSRVKQQAMAQRLLGEEAGLQLLPFINEGGLQNRDRLRGLYARLGINRTEEGGRKVETLRDQASDLGLIMAATIDSIAEALAPLASDVLATFTNEVTNLIQQLGGGAGIARQFTEAVRDMVGFMQSVGGVAGRLSQNVNPGAALGRYLGGGIANLLTGNTPELEGFLNRTNRYDPARRSGLRRQYGESGLGSSGQPIEQSGYVGVAANRLVDAMIPLIDAQSAKVASQ